ncbi:MAG: tripartite tricarboxylate transporter TctB family protein [Peptococcaceae bacterium]
MKFINKLTGISLVIIGAILYFISMDFPARAGFYAKGLNLLLIFSGLLLFLLNIKKDVKDSPSPFKDVCLNRLFIAIVVSLAYILLIKKLGYIMSSMLFAFFLMRFLGVKEVKILLMVSILVPLILYLGFDTFLSVPLPKGIFI